MTEKDTRPATETSSPADGSEAEADTPAALTPAQAIEVARAAAAEQVAEEEQAEDDSVAGESVADKAVDDTTLGEGVDDPSAAPEAARDAMPEAVATAPAAASPAPPPEVSSPAPSAAPAPPPSSAPAPAKTLATPIAWLALILVILLALGGFNQLLDLQRREAALRERLQGLESVSGQDDTTFDQMRDNLQRQIELELEGIAARQARVEEEQERSVSRLEGLVDERAGSTREALAEEIAALQQRLRDQQLRINDLSIDDRQSWQLAEAQYLLRLANQRLIMTGDTSSAEALLRSADGILRELGAADLHDLREAVASDLAAVRAVPRLDTQGLYLRLEALIRQTDALVLFELPGRAPEVDVAPAEDWRGRLSQGVDAAVAKLSEYVVVSRRDVPVETLMDPQYEGLVRQNMRMLLEQAQVAMLSGNEILFRQSLERAEGWVTQFFKSDQQAAQAMAEELRLLREERISVTLPDLSASLTALEAVMRARLAADGA